MGLNVGKNDVISAELFTELVANVYDTNFYTEPDGSIWIRIFHHNNPAGGRFASSDPFDKQVYKDADKWFNVALCDQIKSGKWELMVKQKTTSDATETKWRWIQSTNPMAGSYNDVKAANVTKITTSGYSVSDVAGGAYKARNQTYIVIANANSGNWFGAIGAWGEYNGGIPGYPNTTVTTGYMDLYLRVDYSTASFGKKYVKGREIIEI